MIVLPEDMKVLVSVAPLDMRKSIDELTVLVVDVLKQNPQSRCKPSKFTLAHK